LHPLTKNEMAKKVAKPVAKQEQKGLEEALTRSEQFFENNKKTIFGILIAVIVIIAGAMLYKTKVAEPREIKAAEAIFPGETYFTNGDYTTALNGDAYGFEGFESLAGQYRSTKAGKLAYLYAGLCYAQLDSMEVAEKYLSKFDGKDQMVGPAALGALANCYATAGNVSKAAATFEKAAKKADNNLLSPYYLFQAALMYESLDKKAQALKLYNQIKVKYPESNEGIEAEKYITRLTSK